MARLTEKVSGIILLEKVSQIESIKIFAKSSYFERLLFHGINVVLILSILGLVNYLGNKNYKEFDFTSEKRNSLTDQTQKILEMVKAPMQITLYAKREEWGPILNLLKLFEGANKKIKLNAFDTDLRPDLIKLHNITQNGTVTIDYQGKHSQFVIVDELSVTNALLKSLQDKKVILYFITGHQELSCSEITPEGISQICEKLKDQNYNIRELDLTKVTAVPQDATGVFVLGPTTGFLQAEADILKKYVNDGGSLFLALAPAFKTDVYDNLIEIMKPFGLTMGKDVVIDRLSTVQGAEATIPIVSKYEQDNPITKDFIQRTIFPLSSSVKKIRGDADSAQIIAMTSPFPGSWAETDLKGVTEGKAAFDEKKDDKGPIGLLGISEGTRTSTSRVILLGSSSFLVNSYQNQSGNSMLLLNSVSWLVGDEGIISFNRPGIEESPVILSAQHLQMIFVISILVVPIVFFGAAIFIYRRRRLL
jgi:ABC-type uncharacterized transport system involved in gliding motility auxiliary subunit